MKVVCDKCYGTDVVKENGVYVCKTCGNKGMDEEANTSKKLMYTNCTPVNPVVRNSKVPAILSLVFGILALVLLLGYYESYVDFYGVSAILFGIAGTILGIFGWIKRYGRGMGIAGTICSSLSLFVAFAIW